MSVPVKVRKRRPGGGRKKNPETVLREMDQAYRLKEAQKSFIFICKMRDNPEVPHGIRLAAAQDIQDRVFGKPKQAVEHSGTVSLEQVIGESRS